MRGRERERERERERKRKREREGGREGGRERSVCVRERKREGEGGRKGEKKVEQLAAGQFWLAEGVLLTRFPRIDAALLRCRENPVLGV